MIQRFYSQIPPSTHRFVRPFRSHPSPPSHPFQSQSPPTPIPASTDSSPRLSCVSAIQFGFVPPPPPPPPSLLHRVQLRSFHSNQSTAQRKRGSTNNNNNNNQARYNKQTPYQSFQPQHLPAQLDQPFQPHLDMVVLLGYLLLCYYVSVFCSAWECSGSSNIELISNLAANKIIQSRRVYDAMMGVDRKFFVPKGTHPVDAYQDAPHSIGFGATISAPHMHAMCLELLADKLQPGGRALDVGSGSGYLVACMDRMIRPAAKVEQSSRLDETELKASHTATSSTSIPQSSTVSARSLSQYSVIGIEHIDDLVHFSQSNLRNWDPTFESSILVMKGDGRLGVAGEQFDAIHVGAAAEKIPEALIQQLKLGGRLIIPVGKSDQHLLCIDKDKDGRLTQKSVTGVRYVPLTDESKQLRGV